MRSGTGVQVFLSYQMWVLGTERRSSARVASAINP